MDWNDGFALTEIGDYSAEWSWTFFFFQAVFAATAATIVSGAVAERTSFKAYLIFSIVITPLFTLSLAHGLGVAYLTATDG